MISTGILGKTNQLTAMHAGSGGHVRDPSSGIRVVPIPVFESMSCDVSNENSAINSARDDV